MCFIILRVSCCIVSCLWSVGARKSFGCDFVVCDSFLAFVTRHLVYCTVPVPALELTLCLILSSGSQITSDMEIDIFIFIGYKNEGKDIWWGGHC